MKKNKVITLSAVFLLGVGTISDLAVIGSHQDSIVYAAKKKKVSKKQKVRNNFDKIAVCDMANMGEGGSTVNDVKKMFGEPSSTSTSQIDGVNSQDLTWSKSGITITIQFIESKAVARSITGFEYLRKDRIGLKEFNALADGTSYDQVIAQFKKPDSITETIILGSKTTMATWVTGVKGDFGSSVVLTFTDNALTGKAQTNIKD